MPCRKSRASSSSNTPCRSTCRWSTCTRSARAADRSLRSTPRACCGSGRRAPAPGPVQSALARELGIPTVLVPARPGITNALGCVVADLRHDYVRTVNKPLSAIDDKLIAGIYAEQSEEGRATIEREGVAVRALRYVHTADMQFQGQSHIL